MSVTIEAPTVPQPEAPIEEWVGFYRRLGFNVIPARPRSKQPAVEWTAFEGRRATDEEVSNWLRDGLFQNIAVVCGETSGNLAAIDFDEMDAYKQCFDNKIEDEALVVRSGSGRGVHVYMRGNSAVTTSSYEDQSPKFSIRGRGAVVILPPSIHPDGGRYEIISRQVAPIEVGQIEESITQLLTRLGVKDRSPPTMSEVVKGVAEGGRELNMYRLAWYLLKIVKLSKQDAWADLQKRNQLNDPPLPDDELKHCFNGAKKARSADQLDSVARTEFELELDPTPDERELARKILKSSHVLQIIKILLDENVRKEYRNKVYAFLIMLTAKHPNPAWKQILVLGGSPGGGKTTVANILKQLVRTKKVGRFTEHAMDYSDLQKYEMLYIQELLDLEQQKKMGVSSVRFLSADDQGYTVELTSGDAKTGFKTQQRKIPAMTVISTTTVVDTEAQFERRIHRMNMDESRQTTRAVLDWKAQEEKRAVFEWLGDIKPRRGVYILKAIIDALGPCHISTAAISHTMSEVLKDTYLRARGDYNKLLALTGMVAWLHQQQRPYVTRTVSGQEERMIFALPQDAYYALEIGLEPILTMMTQLDKRLRDLLPTVYLLKDSKYIYKRGKDQDTLDGFSINQLLPKAREAVKPDLPRHTLYLWLKTLEDRGILAVTKAGNENVYSLISTPENMGLRVGKVSDSQSESEITVKLQKEAESFFSSISQGLPQQLIGLTPADWFDTDELDRDLTPLLEQATEAETALKVPLKERKDRVRQRQMGGLSDDKTAGPTAKEGSQ